MHATIQMSLMDHFVATVSIGRLTPTYIDAKAAQILATAYRAANGDLRLHASGEDLNELLHALDECVELWGCDLPENQHELCCDAYRSTHRENLKATAKRLEMEIEEALQDYDRDETVHLHEDGHLVDYGPEYPRNDAGEWLGRM